MAIEAFAIAGHLVDADKINNRNLLTEKIPWVIAELAGPFQSHWLAPPRLVRGIESFVAVTSSLRPVFDLLVALNEALWPHRFRLGVGGGGLDAGWDSGEAGRLDGPAFRAAEAALATAQRLRRPLALECPAADPVLLHAVETLAAAHAALVAGWTPAAARHVPLLRAFGQQAPVAQALGVSQQVVSTTQRRARYRTLLEIEAAANEIIADRLADDDAAMG